MVDTGSPYDFEVIKNADIEKYKHDFDKVDTIKLDLRNNKLSKGKWEELFQRLSATKIIHFQLNLDNYDELDDSKVMDLVDCLKVWNLHSLVLNFSNVKLTDAQFEQIFYEAICMMTKLVKLAIDIENVKFDEFKARCLEKLLQKLQLKEFYLNIRRNHVSKDELARITKFMSHIPSRELLIE